MNVGQSNAPLSSLKVVEFAGVGPAPFVGMQLQQMGADVLRIERAVGTEDFLNIPEQFHFMNRGKARLKLDLKEAADRESALEIVRHSDVLIEGYRPGVMERLGLGPERCHARHPALIYGRVTGWGQYGPLANEAGHDITYLAVSGVLNSIGTKDGAPIPPLNLLGDFAGGGMYLTLGILAALHAAKTSGKGQVIDAAMVDGAIHLATFIFGLRQAGMWNLDRGANSADGGFPFYGTYATSDGRWLAVAAVEEKFRRAFIEVIGLPAEVSAQAEDFESWPAVKAHIAAILATKSRNEWCKLFHGKDACVAPVLDLDEVRHHPHVRARNLFNSEGDAFVPALAPKFSTPFSPQPNTDAKAMLASWGLTG